MNKKYIILGLALILALLFTVSCGGGISQEQYNKANTDLAAALGQVQKLQSDLSAAQAQTQKVQSDLASAQDKIDQARIKVEILNAFFIPAFRGELDTMTESDIVNYFLKLREKVIALEDDKLTAKLQAIIDTGGEQQTMEFFLYLLESLPETLE